MIHAIDLNKELSLHPAATFFGRVVGDSMKEAGVSAGDILVIDRALEPQEGDMVVCSLDGEFVLKRISFGASGGNRSVRLVSASPDCPDIVVDGSMSFSVWGVVTYFVKKVKK